MTSRKTPMIHGKLSQDRVAALHAAALDGYRATCFWNMEPPATIDGLRAIAERLKTNGNMKAWRFAEQIEEELGRAGR